MPIGRIEPTKTVYEFISQAQRHRLGLPGAARGRERDGDVRRRQGQVPVRQAEAGLRRALARHGRRQEPVRPPCAATTSCGCGPPSPPPTRSARWRHAAGTSPRSAPSPPPRRPPPTPASTSAPHRPRQPAPFPTAKLVETRTPYDKQAEVKSAAAALADDVTSSFAELEAVVRGNPKLRPGVPVALADVGTPFEGKYTATVRAAHLRRRPALRDMGDGQRAPVAFAVRARLRRRSRGRLRGCTAWPTRWSPMYRTR